MRAHEKRLPADPEVSPDSNIAKINVGGGAVGLLITIGLCWGVLLDLPEARWFLAVALPAGLIAALILHYTARDRA
jgi:hypothetical protein